MRDDANVISHAGGGRQEERLAICKHIGGAKTSLSICVWTDGGGTSSFGAADETDKSIGSPSHQLPFRANRWKDGRTDARTDANGRTRTRTRRARASESNIRARAPCSSSPLPPSRAPFAAAADVEFSRVRRRRRRRRLRCRVTPAAVGQCRCDAKDRTTKA